MEASVSNCGSVRDRPVTLFRSDQCQCYLSYSGEDRVDVTMVLFILGYWECGRFF